MYVCIFKLSFIIWMHAYMYLCRHMYVCVYVFVLTAPILRSVDGQRAEGGFSR